MVPFLPNKLSNTAIYLYLGSLAAVTFFFYRFAMGLDFIVMGIVWVVGFFGLASLLSRQWSQISEKAYVRNLLLTALGLRMLWVVFSMVFYTLKTGIPFEFEAADSMFYHGEAMWMSQVPLATVVDVLFTSRDGWSDSGYLFYLQMVYRIVGPSVLVARLLKCVWGTLMVYLLYRLAQRNLGDQAGRMAGVFACLMPNLIIYCGLHLKEVEMLLLMVATLERADYLIRSRHYTVFTVATPVLLALSLFTFRTVLGISAFFSMATALLFTSPRVIGRTKRWVLIAWSVLALSLLVGGNFTSEVAQVWENRLENQAAKREYQTAMGSRWARYATGTVMMPMMVFLPYPTMVNVSEQYNQQVMSGGNFVRNYLGIFVLIAIYSAVFVNKNWRDLSLVGSFTLVYLGIVSMSGFANAERFLLPGLPGLLVMAASGVSLLNANNYRAVRLWSFVVVAMALGWAYFKVGHRGLL